MGASRATLMQRAMSKSSLVVVRASCDVTKHIPVFMLFTRMPYIHISHLKLYMCTFACIGMCTNYEQLQAKSRWV
jgi:hypothetical protein